MNEKAILFSGSMVKAILDGSKTETRRIVKPQPEVEGLTIGRITDTTGLKKEMGKCFWFDDDYHQVGRVFSPYALDGQILWVRETWQHTKVLNLSPDDDNYGYIYRADGQPWDDYEGWTWKPSLFMPKDACRIRLNVGSVHVERLQDISKEDAIAEGIQKYYDEEITKSWRYRDYLKNAWGNDPIESFKSLWISINGEDSWGENPFVWVVKFNKQ